MAFIVPRKNGSWEIRETRQTPSGPRSTTLASFREMGDDVIERAGERAARPLDPDELRNAALRAGAPLAIPLADQAAEQLLAEASAGHRPRRALRRLLADTIGAEEAGLSAEARAVQEWVNATPERRGKALKDLLGLVDALPPRRRSNHNQFPPFRPVET